MPSTVSTPAINITAAPATPIPVLASSPSFNSTLRRPSLALSVGSFHAAQLRRPSFFSPLPYSHSPQYSDLSHGTLNDAYGSSPRIGGDVYERDLEANYCKNFSCCGLTLGDLHALLQHYEEAHVRFEEDDFEDDFEDLLGFTDDDGWSTHSDHSTPSSPQMESSRSYSSTTTTSQQAKAAAAATVAALTAATLTQKPSLLLANKKSNGVSLSDIYSEDSTFMIPDEAVSAFPNSVFRSSSSMLTPPAPATATQAAAVATPASSKKRDLSAFSSSFDTQSPISKKVATLSNSRTSPLSTADIKSEGTATGSSSSQEELMSTVTSYLEHAIQNGLLPNCGEVGSPSYLLAAEELLQKREEIVSMMESIGRSGSSGADKPYRCSVDGCDKAYKNPNGLKYHHQHGHCSVSGSSEDDKSNVKPYRCTFLDCGKCYKNLNGLKYHIEHSHPNLAAALQAHITGAPAMDGAQASQTAIAAAAAIAAVKGDSVMMSAIHAIISSNANGQRSSAAALTENTPEPSPNSSPVLAPVVDASSGAAVHSKNPYSTNVTPLTSPVLSRATLSIQTTLTAIQKQQLTGLPTPASLSPTSPHSPVSSPSATAATVASSQVSTLTAALAAVAAEQQRLLLLQQQ